MLMGKGVGKLGNHTYHLDHMVMAQNLPPKRDDENSTKQLNIAPTRHPCGTISVRSVYS